MATVLYKTKICNYAVTGSCRHGSNCLHAHSKEELRPLPDFQKTKLCRKFMKGMCNDEDCTRAHGESELRILDQFYKKKICKYWKQQGSCIRGLECYFAHSESEVANANDIAESFLPSPSPSSSPSSSTPSTPSTLSSSSISSTSASSSLSLSSLSSPNSTTAKSSQPSSKPPCEFQPKTFFPQAQSALPAAPIFPSRNSLPPPPGLHDLSASASASAHPLKQQAASREPVAAAAYSAVAARALRRPPPPPAAAAAAVSAVSGSSSSNRVKPTEAAAAVASRVEDMKSCFKSELNAVATENLSTAVRQVRSVQDGFEASATERDLSGFDIKDEIHKPHQISNLNGDERYEFLNQQSSPIKMCDLLTLSNRQNNDAKNCIESEGLRETNTDSCCQLNNHKSQLTFSPLQQSKSLTSLRLNEKSMLRQPNSSTYDNKLSSFDSNSLRSITKPFISLDSIFTADQFKDVPPLTAAAATAAAATAAAATAAATAADTHPLLAAAHDSTAALTLQHSASSDFKISDILNSSLTTIENPSAVDDVQQLAAYQNPSESCFNCHHQQQHLHNLTDYEQRKHNSKGIRFGGALDCDCNPHSELARREITMPNSRSACYDAFFDEQQEYLISNGNRNNRSLQQKQKTECNGYYHHHHHHHDHHYDERFDDFDSSDALEIINQLIAEKRLANLQQQELLQQLQEQQQKLLDYQNDTSVMLRSPVPHNTPAIQQQQQQFTVNNYTRSNHHHHHHQQQQQQQYESPRKYLHQMKNLDLMNHHHHEANEINYKPINSTSASKSAANVKAAAVAAAAHQQQQQQQLDNRNNICNNNSNSNRNSSSYNDNLSSYQSKTATTAAAAAALNESSLYCDSNGGIENMVVSFLNAIN